MIFISAANGDISLAMARILKLSTSYKIIGLAPNGYWPAKSVFDEIFQIPYASDPNYFEFVDRLVTQYAPEFLIPASEKELEFFSLNPSKLALLKTKVIINNVDLLNIFLDKYNTFQYLSQLGINMPKTVLFIEASEALLPFILKPRKSAGAKNIFIVRHPKHLESIKEEFLEKGIAEHYVAQEYIDVLDQEYTCPIWKFKGEYRELILRRQLQGGMTVNAIVEYNLAISNLLQTFQKKLNFDFFLNFQLRMKNSIPYVFEVNPRFSGTLMMRHKIGFQDLHWTIEALNNNAVSDWQPPNLGTQIFRTYHELIVEEKQVNYV